MLISTSESQYNAVMKYREAKLDRLEVYVPKGYRNTIKAHAIVHQPQTGEPGKEGYSPSGSVTAFVNRAIREAIERDEAALKAQEAEQAATAKPKKKPGRPRKNPEQNEAATEPKRKPGRPRKNPEQAK